MEYIAPERGKKSFTCPHCGVLARQYHYSNPPTLNTAGQHDDSDPVATSVCEHCGKYSLWHESTMVYPNRGNAPLPNPDMSVDVRRDYEEAATISALSPRGAAALLRLAIQKLCIDLGGKGKNINEDIGTLVKHGMPERIQKALDVVRVIGNNAVHPGQIETDDPEVAGNLFVLINVIVESMISIPNKINELYIELPDETLQGIKKRDKPNEA